MTKSKFWTITNYTFFSLVIIACLVLTIVLHLDWLAFVSCAASILYIVFLSDKNILNFIIGFISSSTYLVVAYKSHLYGEAIFYLVVDIPMIFISFVLWKKHMETKLKVESKKLSFNNIMFIFVISAIAVVGYGFILKAIGGANTFVDALSTVVTLVATILMALRYREQWIMWIVVYVVSVVLWSTTFDLLMLIMSCSCLLSSIVGFIYWSKSAKVEESVNE